MTAREHALEAALREALPLIEYARNRLSVEEAEWRAVAAINAVAIKAALALEKMSENTSKVCRLEPTDEMRTAGARRLLSFEDGTKDEDFSALQWAASRNEADRVWRSMWIEAGDGWEVGWVIEHRLSPVHSPNYWAGNAWSTDHMRAIRYARKSDAEFSRNGFDDENALQHRVAEHAWDVRPRPLPADHEAEK